MRLLLTVSRARRSSSDSWTAQRDASLLYARFYAGLLGGILLTYQLQRCVVWGLRVAGGHGTDLPGCLTWWAAVVAQLAGWTGPVGHLHATLCP